MTFERRTTPSFVLVSLSFMALWWVERKFNINCEDAESAGCKAKLLVTSDFSPNNMQCHNFQLNPPSLSIWSVWCPASQRRASSFLWFIYSSLTHMGCWPGRFDDTLIWADGFDILHLLSFSLLCVCASVSVQVCVWKTEGTNILTREVHVTVSTHKHK